MNSKRRYKIFELFSGAGGLSLGFSMTERFEIIGANEILKEAGTAYSLNHPETQMFIQDIRDITEKQLKSRIGEEIKNIDLVIGGPPCQAYSTVGKRLMSDPRATLFQEYIRMLKIFKPKVFLFENVKGLLSMQKGELFETIIEEFEKLGYKTYYKVLNSADYGVPQVRERVIVVGTLLEQEYRFPEKTHTSDNYLSIADAISDLPSITENGGKKEAYEKEPMNDYQKQMRKNVGNHLTEHFAPKNNDRLRKLMELLPDGGSPKDIPEEYRPSSGFGNTYCRLWWNKPSTTITRNLGTPSSSRCIHPIDPRPLSTREGARLQSFPDDYMFFGSKTAKNLQIGEAVPPLLGFALGKSIVEYLDNK
jgi:DNA (cytosine-5)-methyltransferase 1